jgi:hypothetical protein
VKRTFDVGAGGDTNSTRMVNDEQMDARFAERPNEVQIDRIVADSR